MAKAFNLPLELNQETVKRMHAGMVARGMDPNAQDVEQRTARERMAQLPTGKGAECIFVAEDKWVPVVRLGGKVSLHQASHMISQFLKEADELCCGDSSASSPVSRPCSKPSSSRLRPTSLSHPIRPSLSDCLSLPTCPRARLHRI
jgi:hypothetical protein